MAGGRRVGDRESAAAAAAAAGVGVALKRQHPLTVISP